MHKRIKKLGLFFSVVAVLFVTVILPFHYHSETANKVASDHCTVCHFSGTARAVTPPSQSSGLVVFNQSELVFQKLEVFRQNVFSVNVSPRGPPSLS